MTVGVSYVFRMLVGSFGMNLYATVATVSYAQLDVYKRQVVGTGKYAEVITRMEE